MNEKDLFESFGFDGQAVIGSDFKSAQIADLAKALTANESATDYVTTQGGGALQPQSLETTRVILAAQEQHIKLQKRIGIGKAFSTIEEYTVQDGYGTESITVDQMTNPEEDDAELYRDYAKVKFMRAQWRVGDVLQATRTLEDPKSIQIQSAMMRVMRGVERQLFTGDDNIVTQEILGLRPMIEANGTSEHIIDLRGGNITQAHLAQAAELVYNNAGMVTDMYVSTSTITTMQDILANTNMQRAIQNQLSGGQNLGIPINGFDSKFGSFPIEPSIFLDNETQGVTLIKNTADPRGPLIEGATSAKAPAAPTIVVTATANANTLFSGGENLKFRVIGVNQYGKSVASVEATAAAPLSAGQQYQVAITQGGGTYAEVGYIVLRETGNGTGIFRKIAYIKKTGSPMNYNDYNQDIPGTAIAFLGDFTSNGAGRAIAGSQLMPMHQTQFAKIGPYDWGNVNWYLGMKYYAPLKFVMFKNVGVNKAQGFKLLDV